MIQAEHRKWARVVFNPYMDRLIKKRFHRFFITNRFPEIPLSHSLLVAPNHFSWWDGFFIDAFLRKSDSRLFHILMLEEQLKRYGFFKKIGAFSIHPQNPKSMIRTIRYTQQLLSSPKNTVILYPQGEIQPYITRPELKRGLYQVAKSINAPSSVVPVAFKVQYSNEPQPDIFCRFGKRLDMHEVGKKPLMFEDEFYSNLENLEIASHEKQKNYPDFLKK
jgi:1-acyl-sn-glycerol-3-phosphate acyltransferase